MQKYYVSYQKFIVVVKRMQHIKKSDTLLYQSWRDLVAWCMSTLSEIEDYLEVTSISSYSYLFKNSTNYTKHLAMHHCNGEVMHM